MKINVSTKSLLKALKMFSSIIKGKGNNLRFLDLIELTSDNGNIIIRGLNLDTRLDMVVTVPGFDKSESYGNFILKVEYKKLLSIISLLDSETIDLCLVIDPPKVKRYLDDTIFLKIVSGTEEYCMESESKEDFPKVDNGTDIVTRITLDCRYFGNMLKSINPISEDDLRAGMTHVLFDLEDRSIVSTDATALSVISIALEIEGEYIKNLLISKDLISLLKSIQDPYSISITGKRLMILTGESFEIKYQIPDYSYPNWKQVIPLTKETNTQVTITSAIMLKALKKAAIFANSYTKQVVFIFKKDSVEVKSNDFDNNLSSYIEIPCSSKGLLIDQEGSHRVVFNYKYFINLINLLAKKEINLELTSGAHSKGIFSVEGKKVLLMPIIENN